MTLLKITAFFDCACGPRNPGGTMGMGGLVYVGGEVVWEHSEIQEAAKDFPTSNNLAEYLAFRAVLSYILDKLPSRDATIYGDSKLVIEQMTGRWRIKSGIYSRVAEDCSEILSRTPSPPRLRWIPRDQNIHADRLSKAPLTLRGIQA